MKLFCTLIVCALTLMTYAQGNSEKVIGAFKELKVYDLIEVELIKSEENKVVVSGKNTEDLVVVHKKDLLKIRMTLEESFDGDDTTVKVYYTELEIIDANEGAIVKSKDPIEQFELKLRAQEGGKIRLDVRDLKFMNVKAISGGNVTVSGSVKNQTVDINTGGAYEGENLASENTNVTIKAAGVAHVNASKKVDAKVRAGGTVYVYGNPETIDENTILGGKIVVK